jgi:2-iminobutanoate/2-iminopropanoate deaminase
MNIVPRSRLVAGLPETRGPWTRTVEWNGLIFISGLRDVEPSSGAAPVVAARQNE